jgi:hypothetical protein
MALLPVLGSPGPLRTPRRVGTLRHADRSAEKYQPHKCYQEEYPNDFKRDHRLYYQWGPYPLKDLCDNRAALRTTVGPIEGPAT